MALAKRIAVTLPAGPRIEDTVARIQWAEEQGIADAWFSDSGAPDTLTQEAGISHTTKTNVYATKLGEFHHDEDGCNVILMIP